MKSLPAALYLPVLKVKRGEKRALRELPPAINRNITPILEIVERRDKALYQHINTAFDGLAESVASYSRCFIDTREVASDGHSASSAVFERASSEGIVFTPITGISRSVDVASALLHRSRGIALRLTREEFEAGDLAQRLVEFTATHDMVLEETDLILDLGDVTELVATGVGALAYAFLSAIPEHSRWRTFTMSGCAFPQSMGGVGRRSYDLVERTEWLAWRDRLHAHRNELTRLPVFSDCAIQHPAGVEGFDFRTMAVSASIRYSLAERWLLIKGESTRLRRPKLQFPELATQLVYGHLSEHFAGEGHCAGCASIKAAADGAPRLGSAEVWRRLGTIHHLTRTIEDLQALTWP